MSLTSGSPKLLLLHIPGADLQFIHPLVDAGLLPTISSLIDHGTMGNLYAPVYLRYPTSTVTLVTGTRADKHLVLGAACADKTHDTGIRMIQSSDVKTAQLWEMIDGHAAAVGWPASYPAPSSPDNLIISDMFANASGSDFDQWPFDPKTVSDASLHDTFEELRLHPEDVTREMISPFLEDTSGIDIETDERIHEIIVTMARMMTLHGAATWIAQHHPCEMLAVNFDFVERLTTTFMQYQAPRMGHITKSDFARFNEVVNGAYRMLDMMLATYIELLDPDTHIVLTSAHGYVLPDHRKSKAVAGKDFITNHYSNRGVLLAKGSTVKPDALSFGGTTLDIVPTCLSILERAVPGGLDGRVLDDIFKHASTTKDTTRIDLKRDRPQTLPPLLETQKIVEWQTLGYIPKLNKSPEANVEMYTTNWLIDEAKISMFRGNHDRALSLLRDALSIAPNHSDARLRLAQCALSVGDLKEARDAVTDLKDAKMQNPFLEFLEGSLLHSEGRSDEADKIFNKLEDNLPLTSSTLNLLESLGAARMKAKMPAKAQKCYEKALIISPDSIPALNGIGEAKRLQKNYAGAEDSFHASLKILQTQPNVITALGKSQLARGLDPEAEKTFLQALEINPDFAPAKDALRKVRGRKTALTLKADETRQAQ